MDKKKINSEIMKFVEESWLNKNPVLLASLGDLIGGEAVKQAKALSGSLSHYVNQHLTSELRIEKHSKNPVVIAVLPRNAETDGITDFDGVLERCLSKDAPDSIQFRRVVWAAFRKPLGHGYHRFLSTEQDGRFRDVLEIPVPSELEAEVKKDQILDTQNFLEKDVHLNIVEWAKLNGVEITNLEIGKQKRIRSYHQDSLPAGATTLDRILYSLDDSELKRVNLPLDIIKKLKSS